MKLGGILLENGKITKEQLEDTLLSQQVSEQRIGEILIEKGYCTDNDIAWALSVQLGYELILDIKPDFLDKFLNEKIGARFLYDQTCVVMKKDEKKYLICTNLSAQIAEKIALDHDLKAASVIISTKYRIYGALNSIFIAGSTSAAPLNETGIFNEVLEIAISKSSPNVRIKKTENSYLILLDTNLGLDTVRILSMESGKKLINIIAKNCGITLKAGENTDAKTIFSSKLYKGLKINIRLEFLPVSSAIDKDVMLHEAVLRLHGLNKVMDFETLGFSGTQINLLKGIYTYPHGFIISTGPTGSGKTTTFYALLKLLSQKKKAIFTIEDPVEIELKEPNITQMNIQNNFDYPNALRAMLRSEPHIIMVGEIRDEKTARYSLEAAETGHLVLTTLHTNSALSIFNRLKSLNADTTAFLESVRVVTGQRLYAPLCSHCKKKIKYEELPDYFKKSLENSWSFDRETFPFLDSEELPPLPFVHVKGLESCFYCGGSGYEKRKAMIEIAVFTDEIRNKILDLKDEFGIRTIESIFAKSGFKSLKVSAAAALKSGIIDPLQYFQIAG